MKIDNLRDLHNAALNRRAVCVSGKSGRIPAAFVISMQGMTILRYFRMGMTLYEKPKRAGR
jgi:hypothetical protein